MGSTGTRRVRLRYDWTPEQIALLGTMSDADVATRIGGKKEAVLDKRQALRIKAFRPKNSAVKGKARPNFDWNEENVKLLGTMTDTEVARKLGLAITTVGAKRRSLGIAGVTPSRTALVIPPALKRKLGKWSDALIASKLGVASSAVSKARRRLGIPAIMQANYLPPEADEFLGKIADIAVAQRFGVSRTCVGNRRVALGIARAEIVHAIKPRTSLPDEVLTQLGKLTDAHLAKQYGLSTRVIGNRRRELGISAVSQRQLADQALAEGRLGQESDASIAKHYNVSKLTVLRWRQGAGIPSFRAKKATAEVVE